MNSFQSIFQRRRTITLPAGQTHQFICNIYGFFIGNIPGQGGSQLFHLRRVGVCRSLILNKQQNGQNFFSRSFRNGLFAGNRNIPGMILLLAAVTGNNAAKNAVKGMRFRFIMMVG